MRISGEFFLPCFPFVVIKLLHRSQLDAAHDAWIFVTEETLGLQDKTRAIETQRCQAQEKCDHVLEEVQALEHHLGIQVRWHSSMDWWKAAHRTSRFATYQKCLDKLEGLVVQ